MRIRNMCLRSGVGEMTRYGTLVAWAKQLGRNDAATLLNQTLDEEKATDKKLTEMAESQINRKAA